MNRELPKLEWDESYSIGVPDMDADDRQVFAYINKLCDLMMGKGDKNSVEKTLVSLLNLTVFHMLNEEVLLQRLGYPMFDKHVEDHKRYLEEIRGLYVRYFSGKANSRILSAELIAVLTELLQEHIMKADKLYGEFIQKQDVEIAAQHHKNGMEFEEV